MNNQVMIERRKAWVEALRSGDYKQGKWEMYNSCRDTYCCLGVGHKLATGENPKRSSTDGYDIVKEYYGLKDQLGRYGNDGDKALFHHNDTDDYSFNQIADIIELAPEGLFIDDSSVAS